MKGKIYFIIWLVAICSHSLLMSFDVNAQPENYEVTPLCELNLNRTATSLSSSQLANVPPAHKGFIWNDGDNETLKFRPQGITELDLGCRKYIAVSWYGREEENYENRGVRISFADISDMGAINYRHVLLVDENYGTFINMHGGGIHYLNGFLYVPDTRSAYNKRIYAFDLNNIKRVPNEDLDDFHNYRYIVQRVDTYHLPIQPSCVSYDWDSNEFMIATFKNLCDFGCVNNPETTFSWFETATVNSASPYHINFFDRTQGIGSIDDFLYPDQKIIWTSVSYGRYNPSKLHVTTYNRNPNNTQGQYVDFEALTYSTFELPPGLEDIHINHDKDTLWTLTEFGPNEGTNNDRLVFAFSVNEILPPGYSSSSVSDHKKNQSKGIKMYPNPNSGKFFIDLNQHNIGNISIYDQTGKICYQNILNKQVTEINMNLSAGLYFIKFVSDDTIKNQKIIIE
jgi:hypothetical protein